MAPRRHFSPQILDLLSAGTMLPSCILVSWLIYKWMLSNGWISEKWLIGFLLFGIGTGFYNFFRLIGKHEPPRK